MGNHQLPQCQKGQLQQTGKNRQLDNCINRRQSVKGFTDSILQLVSSKSFSLRFIKS